MILINIGSGDPSLLFVYGTLRRASRHPMARLLARQARFLGRGRISGRLYRVGAYPAAVAAKRPGEYIQGDLYDVREHRGLWARLDHYEGVRRGGTMDEYRRVVAAVELAEGGRHAAWVYLYNGRAERLQRLVSGDYLAQRRRPSCS